MSWSCPKELITIEISQRPRMEAATASTTVKGCAFNCDFLEARSASHPYRKSTRNKTIILLLLIKSEKLRGKGDTMVKIKEWKNVNNLGISANKMVKFVIA